ncbi:MAG: hypothetical protein ABEJ72_06545, partial [Candidatus Aenigmatarchaeota archaeon]
HVTCMSIRGMDGLDSPRSKAIYLYVSLNGRTTNDELREDLDMRAIDMYPTISSLEDKGYIERVEDNGSIEYEPSL